MIKSKKINNIKNKLACKYLQSSLFILLQVFILPNTVYAYVNIQEPGFPLQLERLFENEVFTDEETDKMFSKFPIYANETKNIQDISNNFDKLKTLQNKSLSKNETNTEIRKNLDIKGASLFAASAAFAGMAVGMHFAAQHYYNQYNILIDTVDVISARRSTQACDSFMIIFGLTSASLGGLAGYYLGTGPDREVLRNSQIYKIGEGFCIYRGY